MKIWFEPSKLKVPLKSSKLVLLETYKNGTRREIEEVKPVIRFSSQFIFQFHERKNSENHEFTLYFCGQKVEKEDNESFAQVSPDFYYQPGN